MYCSYSSVARWHLARATASSEKYQEFVGQQCPKLGTTKSVLCAILNVEHGFRNIGETGSSLILDNNSEKIKFLV